MEWTQRLRGRSLGPLLAGLHAAGVTCDHVTLLSLAVGTAFLPLWLAGLPGWALAALALHVLLDGLDGPLARFAGVASPRGSFTDTTSDQIVVALVTAGLMATGAVGAVAGGVYIFLYTAVVVFAMVRQRARPAL